MRKFSLVLIFCNIYRAPIHYAGIQSTDTQTDWRIHELLAIPLFHFNLLLTADDE